MTVKRPSLGTLPEKYTQKSTSRLFGFCRTYKLQIIWLTIFYLVQVFLFGMGLVHYFRDWLPTTGGKHFSAASMCGFGFGMVLQFNCAILVFIPAFRWTTGLLRRTWLSRIIPFDSIIAFHVILGFTIAAVAVAHITSFIISLAQVAPVYKIPLGRMLSVRGIIGSSHFGLTTIAGWILLSCLTVMILFALPPMRARNYDLYYWTHKLQLVFWATLIIHAPNVWKFMVAPLALYFVEKLHKYINAIRWAKASKIVQVNLLPMDVTHLVIRRPKDFQYNPGDYVFVKIPSNGVFSWHPFTLSSAPEQKDHIWLHIKASGNYTRQLHTRFAKQYISNKSNEQSAPTQQVIDVDFNPDTPQPVVPVLQSIPNLNIQVFLDGPYGASTTALFHTEHAVLVGGGIGVTPFASILGSILAQYRHHHIDCPNCHHVIKTKNTVTSTICKKLKKVDFIWVCKEQEQIQWFIDLLHGWEKQQPLIANDELFMSCHIYLTAKLPKLTVQITDTTVDDLKRPGHGVLGLRSEIKTGRPNWTQVFDNIDKNKKGQVRVFFCGPYPMEKEVRRYSAQHDFSFAWESFY